MFKSHKKIEKSLFILLTLTLIVVSIGGLVELIPLFKKEVAFEVVEGMRPYSPLELIGSEIYKREGCYSCHSQQIRTLREDVERYGHYSLAVESMYDRPFVWGSKRTGPDLARVGGKYSDDWHTQHLIDPRSLVPESIMPGYPFLRNRLQESSITEAIRIMEINAMLGVPYTKDHIEHAKQDIGIQAGLVEDQAEIELFRQKYPNAHIGKAYKNEPHNITELDALVAYLQGLGNKVDLKTNKGRDW